MSATSWFAVDPESGDVIGIEHARVAEALRASGWDVATVSARADGAVEA